MNLNLTFVNRKIVDNFWLQNYMEKSYQDKAK